MRERMVDVTTADGVMNVYLFQPDREGPWPIVVFYMDSAAVREELCDMCRRIASVGYFVMLPNMFYRETRAFDFDMRRAGDPAYADKTAMLWTYVRSLSVSRVAEDTRALLAFADGEPSAGKGKIGVVGHCMSGRYAFAMAGHFPQRVGAAASFYGSRFIEPYDADSPHVSASRIRGEMYFGVAGSDQFVPEGVIQSLDEFLKANDVAARIERYPDAHHGFAFSGRREYDKPSAERHWERLFDMWKRNL